jgi:hypothetical protein
MQPQSRIQIGCKRALYNPVTRLQGALVLVRKPVVNRRSGKETKKEHEEHTLYRSSQRTRQVHSSAITSLQTRFTLLRAAVFCGPANARIFGSTSSGQTSVRNSITLGVEGSEDSVVSVSIDDSEDGCQLRRPRSCLKVFIRSMDGGSFVFITKDVFFLLLTEMLLLAVLSRDFFLVEIMVLA